MPSLSLPSVLVAVLILSGCSSGGGGGGAESLGGSSWQGTWATSARAERIGVMSLIFQTASGGAVSGIVGFDTCGGSGSPRFNGTRTGNHVSLTIVYEFQDPDLRIDCELDIAGSSITGTYAVASNNCTSSLGGSGTTGELSFCRVDPLDVSGEWEGTWGLPQDEQRATASFSQVGNVLTGTIELTGHPCITVGEFSGELNYTSGDETFGEVLGFLDRGDPGLPSFSLGGQAGFLGMNLRFFEGSECPTFIALARPSPCSAPQAEAFHWERRQTAHILEKARTVLVVEHR